MTLEQFKEALIEMGYKLSSVRPNHYLKRNKEVCVQKINTYTNNTYINIYYTKEIKDISYEYNQHRVTDFKKALANISKFERKLGL